MEKLADALVYAISHINLRETAEDDRQDVKALEYLSYLLEQASEPEKDALAAAAKRAFAAEIAAGSAPDSSWARDYSTWMEDLFGEGWQGNDRVPVDPDAE